MSKTALIIGAGKIGRGFLGQLLYLNGWDLIFTDYSQEIIDALNSKNEYTVHILGNDTKNTTIKDYTAFNIEDKKFFNAWEESSLIFTAVGGKNFPSIASVIAKAYERNSRKSAKNIIACENWNNAAEDLESEILAQLNKEEKTEFKSIVGVTEAVVMRIAVEPSEQNKQAFPADVWVQDYWELPINQKLFLGEPPKLQYLEFISDFGPFLERKLYTNNASNATIAYLGYQKGYKYTAEAANDPEIEKILDKVYLEINEMIVKELGVDKEEQKAFAEKAKRKYSDKTIIDPLYRHAADPIRKLGPKDRLVSPARLALKHDILPTGIVKTIVAALHYDYPEDPIAIQLKNLRKNNGLPYILKNILKLDSNEKLYQLILQEIEEQEIGDE